MTGAPCCSARHRFILLRDGQVGDEVPFGSQPFHGSVTTPFLPDGDNLYLGIEEAGTAQLLALRLR